MKKLIAILSLNVGVLPCFGDGCFFPRFGLIWLSSASFLSPIFTQIWVRNGVYQTYGFLGGPQFWETPKFRYGIQLWGMVLQREPLRELGMTMLSLCATTIREFFLMTEDNPHHPADFVTNHVTGWPFLESNVSFPEVSLDKTWFVDELFEGVASRSCLMLNISILFRQAFSSRTKWTMLPGLGGGMTLFTASRCSQWLLLCSWSGLLNFASRSAICWGRFSGDNGKKRAPHSIPCTNDGSSNSSVTSPSSLQKFDKVVLCFLNWW